MKKPFFLLFLLIFSELSAQAPPNGIYPILSDPNSKDFSDLEAFKKKIGDARIVFLGDRRK